ncbi:MAG: hypothetical protein A2V91_04665 [Candidatus Muproteobacteria bacterium RBG_16_64_10]|uniref:Carbon storage regulator n=1 Tax=Candidatus Muproteobacteria bacterium RBG_16_64_10 TaxID=1817757 RepID=A0A1F6T0C5_9PROT|nr:MAG: hypothetical protein A2V91_04665 [Candidatus Muproteobacteria bacterium RBG_16_64_10]
MLILTRRSGQSIRLMPDPGLDPATPIGDLFRGGPIQIYVWYMDEDRLRLGIEAPAKIVVLRDELLAKKR